MSPLPSCVAGVEFEPLYGALQAAGRLDLLDGGKASVAVYDSADVGSPDAPIALLILAVARGDEAIALHFLPGLSNAAVRQRAADDTTTATKVLRHIVAESSIPTCRGNVIRLDALSRDGVRAELIEPLATDVIASSNRVSGVTIAGRPYLHKTYCRLDPNNNEAKLARALGAGDNDTWAPRFLLGYEYEDRASGRVYPLGFVSEYFDGSSFDQALVANVKALWRLALNNDSVDSLRMAVRAHVQPLAPLLEHVGRFLFGFHTELAVRLGGVTGREGPLFAVDRFAPALTARATRLSRRIEHDPVLPAARRRQLARLLPARVEAALDAVLTTRCRALQAGFCHGDLHLSNLLLRPEGPHWQIRVVDISTPCLDRRAAGFTMQCAWQDLIALRRGLEYFVSDELCSELATILSVSPEEASCNRALVAIGQRPRRDAEAQAARAEMAAALWCRFVLGRLMRAYLGSAAPISATDAVSAWRLFYVARLMHELEYNMDHARTYFLCMDYYYLASDSESISREYL